MLIADQFPLGRRSIHGPSHWERVDAWGQRLAASTPGADLVVVRLFAVFHDSRQVNEGADPQPKDTAARRDIKLERR
ncbi:MAG: hypothetical protein U0992_20160 [Planctomycetaceae bacterium]